MEEEINPNSGTKRVLFVVTQSEFGGAQRFVYQVLTHLDSAKYQVAAATGADGDGEFTKAVQEKNISIYTIAALKRNSSIWTDIKAVFEIRRLLKAFDPETVFLNSSKAGFIGALAARLWKKTNVIYRIGGWSFNDPWPPVKKKFWLWLEKISARWKDTIVLNNAQDLIQAQKLGIKPRKELVLIHNGIDPYKINFYGRDEARLKLFEMISKDWGRVFQTRYIIGTIANFYPTKSLETLIEAASQSVLPEDSIFCIIGDGQERIKIEEQIKMRKLQHKVFLLGRIPDAYKLMTGLDVFVLTSIKEGFSWSLLEAMAAKLPVITTAVGAAAEIIENGKNGFIVPVRRPQAIADLIKEILANDRLAQELGIQAHQTVLFKFNLEKMISSLEALL